MKINDIQKVRVVLVDDHEISGLGTKAMLSASELLKIENVFTSAADLMSYLEFKQIDVVVTDIVMPEIDGFNLLKMLKQQFPLVKVIMLSISDDYDSVHEALSLGADGYLLKDIKRDDFVNAIIKVNNGHRVLSDKIMELLINHFIENKNQKIQLPTKQKGKLKAKDPNLSNILSNLTSMLTDREVDILKLIATGNSTKEIGSKLDISPYTVSTHRKNIYAKLGIEDLSSLLIVAKSLLK